MAKAPVLAALRCLSALPTHSVGAEYLGPLPAANEDGTGAHDGLAQPFRYRAFLQRKVLSAMAAARKQLRTLQSPGVVDVWQHQGEAAGVLPHPDALGMPPQPSPGAEPISTQPVPSRKRSAVDAGLEAARPAPVLRQPSSVNIASSSLSDDGATPTAPAGHPTSADASFGAMGLAEQVVEQRLLPPGHVQHSAAPPPPPRQSQHQVQQRQLGAAQGPAAASQFRAQQSVPRDYHPQPEALRHPLRPGPVQPGGNGPGAAPFHPADPAQGHRHYGQLAPPVGLHAGPPSAQPSPFGRGEPRHVPVPTYGGVLYPPPQALDPRSMRPGPYGAAQYIPQQPAGLPPQGGSAAPQEPAAGPERQRTSGLCSLPAPSVSLQELLAWPGHGAAAPAPAGRVRKPQERPPARGQEQLPTPQQASVVAQHAAVVAGPATCLAAALAATDPRVRAAVEQTAAAAAARQQEQLSALPALRSVLHRWPLDALRSRYAGSGEPGACAAGRVDAGAGEWPQQVLRFVQTALPRRSAAVELRAAQALPGTTLPLETMATPLPVDACQTRQDLWDLFLVHLQQLAASASQGAAVDLHAPAAAADAGFLSCLLGGQCLQEGCQAWNGASGSNDDSDVYITDEGLAALASLADAPADAGDWQLAFLVKPRQHAAECAAPAAAAAGAGELQAWIPPPVLYFAGPFRAPPELLLDSWTRMCTGALAAHDSAATADAGAQFLTGEPQQEVLAEDEEDCPHCQQDEWRLGGLSLLVLSHCRVGLRDARGGGGGGQAAPLHLMALATTGRGETADPRVTAPAAHALQSPEVACRVELMSPHASAGAMAAVVDPTSGDVLGRLQLDPGALSLLVGERIKSNEGCWRLAHNVLMALRRLPPGPYMLCMNASERVLELRAT